MKKPNKKLLKLSNDELARRLAALISKPMTEEEAQAELDKLPTLPEGDTHAIFYNRKK